jgi:hypothetical protein
VARTVKNMHCMGKQMGDRFQRFHRTFRTAWQIYDQGLVAHRTHRAREDRGGSFLLAFAAHFFGYAGDYAIGDCLGGFRGVVAGADSGAAAGYDYVDAAGVREFAELLANFGGVVGDAQVRDYFPAQATAEGDYRGARKVFALASGDGIADG